MKTVSLASFFVLLYSVSAHTGTGPHSHSNSQSSSHSHSHSGRHVCTFMEILTCWQNLCSTSYCASYPDAYCRLKYLPCGCRAAWYTQWGEVDCNVPAFGFGSNIFWTNPSVRTFQHYIQDQFRMRTGGRLPARQNNRRRRPGMSVVDPNPTVSSVEGTSQVAECPPNVLRVRCRENPCWKVELPGAACSPNYCGGCFAEFYRNGLKVECDRCSFPQDIIRASVMISDHSAHLNINRPRASVGGISQSSLPTTEIPAQIPSGSGTPSIGDLHIIPNSGLSGTGSSILAIQGQLSTMGGIFPTDHATGSNSVSKPVGTEPGHVGHNEQPAVDPLGHGSASGSHEPGHTEISNPGPGQHEPAHAVSHVHTPGEHDPGHTGIHTHGSALPPTDVTCPQGKRPAMCANDPCANQVCTRYPEAVCRRSMCGNCQAKWYVNNTEVDCEVCASNVYVASCPANPCDIYSCPAHPDAVCRWTKCASCKDMWYVGDQEVTCDIPWTHRPCPLREQLFCRKKCYQYHCSTDYEAICRVRGCGATCETEYYKSVDNQVTIVPCTQRGFWSRQTP